MSDFAPAAGSIVQGRHRLPVRVYYEDTDFSGVVYHASYLRYLERGRTELLRALHYTQSAILMRDVGAFAFVVRRIAIDFVRPARMDDVLIVETAPQAVKAASVELAQLIFRGDELLVSCQVLVVATSGGRARRMPPDLRGQFARHALEKIAGDPSATSSSGLVLNEGKDIGAA